MRISRFIWLLGLIALMASGCKASKEDVVKEWKESEAALTSYSTKYAAFATVLKSTHATQKKLFDEAGKGKGDVEKMKAAHKGLRVALDPISNYEKKAARIRSLYNNKNVRRNPGFKVRAARDKADKKLAEAAGIVAGAAEITSVAALTAPFVQASGLLQQSLDTLERLRRKGKPKKKFRKKKKKKRK